MKKKDKRSSGISIAERFPELDEIRQVEIRYELNAALTSAVKQGNYSLALQIARSMVKYINVMRRSSNSLFNAQYYCIILNTQLRCALEDAGVHPYRLDLLSNEIAEKIGAFTSYEMLETFFEDIIRFYCELAQEKYLKNYSHLIRLAVSYIHAHLSDNITVKGTAEALSVHADYLSHQFCLEIGMPFITYVNKTRIKQAASLLQNTTLPIQQIATAVGNVIYLAGIFVNLSNKKKAIFTLSVLTCKILPFSKV